MEVLDLGSIKKISYTLNTKKEGKLEFDVLYVWRDDLIHKELTDPHKYDKVKVVQVILKYSLKKYKRKFIDYNSYQKNPKIFDEITLELSDEELRSFSSLFLDNQKQYLGEPFGYIESDGKRSPLYINELHDIKWPEDPIDKLYLAWCKAYEHREKWLKETLGILSKSDLLGVSKAIQNDSILNSIFNNYGVSNNEQIKSGKNEFIRMDQPFEYRTRIHALINQIPGLLNDLIMIEKTLYESNKEQLKISNQYLGEQLIIAKKDSQSAKRQAIIAIILAIFTLLVSSLLGIIQIADSGETSKVMINKMDEIKDEIVKSRQGTTRLDEK